MKSCLPFSFAVVLLATFAAVLPAEAQEKKTIFGKPMRKSGEYLSKQSPPKITARLKEVITKDNSNVIVSLSKQRAYLMVNGETYIDTPISSGKRGHPTPSGTFHILEKDADHRSNIYGAFCDRNNRIVRGGISSRIDSAPSGTHFVGAPMKWFCRLTHQGVGMHVGILPGYPASHGCIRLPEDIAPLIYEKVKTGTEVVVQP